MVRVLHPDYDLGLGSLRSALATEAEGPLEAYSETTALRAELSRLREQYRKLSDSEDLGWDLLLSLLWRSAVVPPYPKN